MTVWLLVALMNGALIEYDVYATEYQCEEMAKMIRDRGWAARCYERTVR